MNKNRMRRLIFACGVALLVITIFSWRMSQPPRGEMAPLVPPTPEAALILGGAQAQIGDVYDANYRSIKFPGGDVAKGRGACTDVVIRALRRSGVDLQKLINADMKANFAAYPRDWGLNAPNTDIDHRRVPNQITFFKRHGLELTTTVSRAALQQWQPGDIVYWNTSGTLRQRLHTGIVAARRNTNGVPFVIHNGWRCVEADDLARWPIIAHFRYSKTARESGRKRA